MRPAKPTHTTYSVNRVSLSTVPWGESSKHNLTIVCMSIKCGSHFGMMRSSRGPPGGVCTWALGMHVGMRCSLNSRNNSRSDLSNYRGLSYAAPPGVARGAANGPRHTGTGPEVDLGSCAAASAATRPRGGTSMCPVQWTGALPVETTPLQHFRRLRPLVKRGEHRGLAMLRKH